MPALVQNNRPLPRPPGIVLFIFFFTLAAIGLNPNGKTSIAVACVSLLIQIALFVSATKFVKHNQRLVSSLHFIYVSNALGQFFIVRMFAPYLVAWIFANLYLAFPTLVNGFLNKLYEFADNAFGITKVLRRNAMHIMFRVMANIMSNLDVVSDLGKSFSWIFAGGMSGGGMIEGITGERTAKSTFAAAKWSAGNALSSFLGEVLAKIPLLLIIPTEIMKYYVLTRAVKRYQRENMTRNCQDIVVMAMVLSLPIANIQVLISAGWVTHMVPSSDAKGLFNYVMGVIGPYASSMISCGILGVVIAENGLHGVERKYGSWSGRILSVLLMSIVDVMTGLCYLVCMSLNNAGVVISCTMLLMLLSSGFFLWRRIMQLIVDEHVINMRERCE